LATSVSRFSRVQAALRQCDVAVEDFVVLFVLAGRVDVQAAIEEVLAGQHRQAAVQLTADLGALIDLSQRAIDFQAFEVTTQHEVDHARDGVGAVQGRVRTGDDFHVLDQQARDGVDIDRQTAAGRTDVATTVHQGQGALGAEVAQVQ
jgi:hypothetical protein